VLKGLESLPGFAAVPAPIPACPISNWRPGRSPCRCGFMR